ncbi:hypothetical protein D917_09069 [Trichinella nativa]|uniref:C3H1-type domain-containing protein n=1 Tax=Trichinella nativa TaxID=6335 RepID=A0A1Y3EIE3_9BILA|nr:hypothetical protein D917_09069 [Trichinella nativa]
MTQMSTPTISPIGVSPLTVPGTNAILSGVATAATAYNPYAAYALNTHPMYSGLVPANSDSLATVGGIINTAGNATPASVAAAVNAAQVPPNKTVVTPRADRVESIPASATTSASACGGSASYASSSKKRPLEVDVASATNSSLMLAAAVLQNKRPAYDKSGVPVFQPVTANPAQVGAAVGPAFHYPQFAALHGIQASYVPVTFPSTVLSSLATNVTTTPAVATTKSAAPVPAGRMVSPSNHYSVAYYDESGQLLDTLPVCRDFKLGRCSRSTCRYVHLNEVSDDYKVFVCRDFAKGRCCRVQCKFYHPPILNNNFAVAGSQYMRNIIATNSRTGIGMPAATSSSNSTANVGGLLWGDLVKLGSMVQSAVNIPPLTGAKNSSTAGFPPLCP